MKRGLAGLIWVIAWTLLAPAALGAGPLHTPNATDPSDTPNASFTLNPAAPLVGQTVMFDGSGSNDPDGDSIASYNWTFGDGDSQTTTSATTTHIYAKRGSYTVSLTVVDSQGHSSAPATKAVVVSSPEATPTADFKITPKSPLVGQAAVFDGSRSGDNDGDPIASYHWTFGDGSSQTTSSATTSHAYAAKGTYIATLTVVDSRGAVSGLKSHSVKVKLTKKSPSYHVPSTPTARFAFSPAKPVKGQLIVFNGSSSSGGGHKIKKYLWSFGDGATQSTRSPLAYHAYGKAGSFTAQLVVQTGKHTISAPAIETVTVGRAHHRHHRSHRVRLSKLRVHACVHQSRRCPARGFRLRFRLSGRDAVVLTVFRHGHKQALKQVVLPGRHGHNSKLVRFKGKRHAHYVLRLLPIGGKPVTVGVVWRR